MSTSAVEVPVIRDRRANGGPVFSSSNTYESWRRRLERRRAKGIKPWVRLLPSERLLNYRTISPTGCWLWTGAMDKDGYGRMAIRWSGQRKTYRVPRVAYVIWNGDIPSHLAVDHICVTPACFNPEHLRLITPKENSLIGRGIPARNARATHCKRGHPFTPENTRMKPKDGHLHRTCKICQNITQREMRERKYGSPTKDRP